MIDPLNPRLGGDARQTATIKDWVRAALGLDAATMVLVTELRCSEPGCPPLETVIAILAEGATHQHKLPKGIADLTVEDVAGIAQAEQRLAERPGPASEGEERGDTGL